jgi:serine/threonine protein kinase
MSCCGGIRYLHRQNIRHKDIKPSNVLISQTGDILITDFGTALDWTENGKSTTQGSRLIWLTPEYCAPEVIAYEVRAHKETPASEIQLLLTTFYPGSKHSLGRLLLRLRVFRDVDSL